MSHDAGPWFDFSLLFLSAEFLHPWHVWILFHVTASLSEVTTILWNSFSGISSVSLSLQSNTDVLLCFLESCLCVLDVFVDFVSGE